MKSVALFLAIFVSLTLRAEDRWIIEFESDIDSSKEVSDSQREVLRSDLQRAMNVVKEVADRAEDDILLNTYNSVPYAVLRLSENQARKLQGKNLIKQLWPDRAVKPALEEAKELIGSPEVISAAFGNDGDGASQRIAIIDSGVDREHPALSGRISTLEYCFTVTGEDSMCPNGENVDSGFGASQACLNGAPHGCGHGTSVSSIASGAPNSEGPSGISGASLISINVFHKVTTSSGCGDDPVPCTRTYTGNILKAIDQVITLHDAGNRVYSVNLSLGGGEFAGSCPGEPGSTAFAALRSRGIAAVAASGNDGFTGAISWPACNPDVIAIGNSTMEESIRYDSNISSEVDLLAPGDGIWAAAFGGEYFPVSGTSVSAPMVSGSLAVMRNITPNITVGDLVSTLKATGTPVSGRGFTFPRISLTHATEDWRVPFSRYVIERARQWSYDLSGTRRVSVVTKLVGNCYVIYEDLRTGSKKSFSTWEWDSCENALISPDGTSIVFLSGGSILYYTTSQDSGSYPVEEFLDVVPDNDYDDWRLDEISADGDMVTLVEGRQVALFNKASGEFVIHNEDHFGMSRGDCRSISISGDESRLAYSCDSLSGASQEIFMKSLDTGLVSFLAAGVDVSLCKDDSSVAYIDGEYDVYHLDLDTLDTKRVSPAGYQYANKSRLTWDCQTVFFEAILPGWAEGQGSGVLSMEYPFVEEPTEHCRTTDGLFESCGAGVGSIASLGGHVVNVKILNYDDDGPWFTYGQKTGEFEIKYLRDPAEEFSIGGEVSGLEGDQVQVENLAYGNFPEWLTITDNGSFAFIMKVRNGGSYSVSVVEPPEDPSQWCIVENGTGLVSGSDVTDVQIICSVDSVFADRFQLEGSP